MGKNVRSGRFYFFGSKITVVTATMELKDPSPRKKSYDKPIQSIIKNQSYPLADKCLYSQIYCFSSSHVWMWELDHKEDWMPKNWCFWTVVLEKTLESSLNCKEIKPVNSKENQSWIFTGRTDAEAEASVLSQPDGKIWLIRKDPDAGKDWRQEEKETTEDEMVGWHHWINGHESEQIPGVSEGQGNLMWWNPWDQKQSDMT